LERYESQCWDLFEDLAEKTLQLEPAFEKLRNSQFIASKGGLISLESFIVVEAKITTLMRKIEALETKEPAKVNKSTHHRSTNRVVHIARCQTMFSKSVQFFKLIKYCRNT